MREILPPHKPIRAIWHALEVCATGRLRVRPNEMAAQNTRFRAHQVAGRLTFPWLPAAPWSRSGIGARKS